MKLTGYKVAPLNWLFQTWRVVSVLLMVIAINLLKMALDNEDGRAVWLFNRLATVLHYPGKKLVAFMDEAESNNGYVKIRLSRKQRLEIRLLPPGKDVPGGKA